MRKFSAFQGLLIQSKRCNKRDQIWDEEKVLEMGRGDATHREIDLTPLNLALKNS